MDLHDSPEEARFRAKARAWLEANLPEGWGTSAFTKLVGGSGRERVAFLKFLAADPLRRRMDAGLDWPREAYGGRGASASMEQHHLDAEEYTRARGAQPDQPLRGNQRWWGRR